MSTPSRPGPEPGFDLHALRAPLRGQQDHFELEFRAPSSADDLAIFSATPAFSRPLHVGAPNLGDRSRLMQRIEDILDRRWFTNNGIYAQEFERKVAELVGVKHCLAMCNGTIALEITIRALDLAGEVIVPAHTFVATAHALQWQQIQPVFCDVDPNSHTLDPASVEAAITERTTGILGVHLFGRGCDVDGLTEVADRHGLQLMFDASHSFSCSHQGQQIGTFGRAECFSFHATKFCSSFEGGAVVTNDDELAERIRLMRNFGFQGMDRVGYIGSNGKMQEVSAAMGLTSLEAHKEFIEVNQTNHALYTELLHQIPGLSVLQPADGEQSNCHYVVVEVDPERAGLDRDLLMKALWAENVLARRYFYPGVHRMEPYCSQRSPDSWSLPVTERLAERIMQLPTGTNVSAETVHAICTLIGALCEHSDRVGQWQPS